MVLNQYVSAFKAQHQSRAPHTAESLAESGEILRAAILVFGACAVALEAHTVLDPLTAQHRCRALHKAESLARSGEILSHEAVRAPCSMVIMFVLQHLQQLSP